MPDDAFVLVASSTVMVCPFVSLHIDKRRLGRNRRRCVREIGRTLLQERREGFLGLCGAQPLDELLVLGLHGRFELADETPA